MGSPTRLSLITCLAKSGRARSVSEVAERCSVAISQTSRTLALLARLGVVESTRRGREVLYCVRYDEVCSALRAAADAIERCCPDTGADSGERGGSRAGR
jgi:predicted transcriptional regulator